ncbi:MULTISPECIES: host cell division inhibitor Icd-like protein [Dickeya]|uniref:Host cell division inhibitor Icd-like protein n=1 Tax=Dickeya dianthicola TaxID=204039 RepID=A0AAX1C0X7_9GAMM|nr:MULTISPECIES: host cell division inhibitor Icd-like protein [Dickeya]MCI4002171.1 host cell division inhibitor Icd-like protein [Dickeya dianthicola]MCO7255668.1 host cell division inhibitor Icd-like protein [Dickeya oryzae]PWD69265.1 host cell division inhibitor Icd-like protein [Dickeya dianthicola]UJR62101.1 host cell division inhibitor Icd-like protein [Dickeya zeae]
MAGSQSTQTRPKFQYRFLALRRHSPNTVPRPLAVEAHSEAEARRHLEPDFILVFAGRLPVQEVRHV